MLIPCDTIIEAKKVLLREAIRVKPSRLLTILIGTSPEQLSYVRIKRQIADEIGVDFHFWQIEIVPSEEEFMAMMRDKIATINPNGVIIQQPLPLGYNPAHIYEALGTALDIEGHREESLVLFPSARATLSVLGWIFSQEKSNVKTPDLINWLNQRKTVIAGRGITTGQPIARAFDRLHIPYTQTNSTTQNPDMIYQSADIIVTAVGQKILNTDNIKPGVILLNLGLRKDGNVLVGDYDEAEIAPIAGYYTKTPGGMGPLDVVCMYENLLGIVEPVIDVGGNR